MLQFNSGVYPGSMNEGRREIIPRKLFIGGLSYDTTDNSLAAYFGQFGEVESATVLRDPVNSHSRGFGFVTFADDIGASNVLAQSRNHIVDGRKVEAKLAFPKTQGQGRQQKQTNQNFDYNPYLKMNQPSLQPLGVGMPIDAFNMQVPFPYEPQQMYPNQQMSLNQDLYKFSNAPQQHFIDRDHLDIGMNPNLHFSSKASYNNLSASVSSQSFQPEGRSPRSSIVDTEQYSQRDVQSLRRKTLSHIHVKADLQSSRKFSGIGDLRDVSGRLEGLGLNQEDYPQSTIYITGIDLNTSAEDINKFCTTFGKVSSARMDRQGFAVVEFESAMSADKILNYQQLNGNLFFEGKEITVSRFHEPTNEDTWEARPFTRSNTFQSGRELFSEDNEPEKIPLMRAMSVTQNMLRPNAQGSLEESNLKARVHLMRDEKSRSLSVIASMNKDNSLLTQQVRVSNRRSSSFADRNLNGVEHKEKTLP